MTLPETVKVDSVSLIPNSFEKGKSEFLRGYRLLFNSLSYLYIFLPSVVIVYFLFNHLKLKKIASGWLVVSSIFFYSYWKLAYLPILLISISVNCLLGRSLLHSGLENSFRTARYRKYILYLGIGFNVSLLAYFKYYDFFVVNVSSLFSQINIQTLNIALPLGISFFTFQQIAYLVDCHKRRVERHSTLDYFLFVSFFPQLIAGPIVHHSEMMSQFKTMRGRAIQWENVYRGLLLLCLGLFKKVVIADTFGEWVNEGYGVTSTLTFAQSWSVSLSYTIQLYFDFSGYTDMALGAAKLINIDLPINFNSPYKALNIQDFWRRWHITLGRFLRDYVYIPLGGNKRGSFRTYFNLFLTFLIGGIWHGAGWTFIIWGAVHGFSICLHRYWQILGFKLPRFLAWLITFLFINTTWVLFRAPDLQSAIKIIDKMYSPSVDDISDLFALSFKNVSTLSIDIFFILVFVVYTLFFQNSIEMSRKAKPNNSWRFAASTLFLVGVLYLMNSHRYSEFLYFQF